MKCQDIQPELPLYFDDILPSETIAAIDAHLPRCPLCRQKIADMQELRSGLRSLARPAVPGLRLESLKKAVAALAAPERTSPAFRLIENPGPWYRVWLLPATGGALASIIFGIGLLWVIMLPGDRGHTAAITGNTGSAPVRSIFVNETGGPDDITPFQYASTRLAISDESPSINPHGALVALTRSLVRGEMRDDEVVVVADVFGNGLARIAEVVEPSHDENKVRELREALQSDPSFAPFVPASMDKRSESVRVVLKFQSVNVDISKHVTAN